MLAALIAALHFYENRAHIVAMSEDTTGEAKIPGAEKKMVAGLLGIFLGWLGIHKFYLGYQKEGIIQLVIGLVTCGGSFIFSIIEGVIYLTKSDEEFVETYITNKKPWL